MISNHMQPNKNWIIIILLIEIFFFILISKLEQESNDE